VTDGLAILGGYAQLFVLVAILAWYLVGHHRS
jgi:hypothetical protein